jgi:hypothetical protein
MARRLDKERNTCALIDDLNGRLTPQEPGGGRPFSISCVEKDGSPSCTRHPEAPMYTQYVRSGEAMVAALV